MAKGVRCPYCNEKHTHGGDSGHRLSHCAEGKTIHSPWGKWMDRSEGYYWMNVNVDDFESLFKALCDQVGKHMDSEIQDLLKP